MSGEEENIPQLDNSVSITTEKPQLDIPNVSLAQGDASLGKRDVGNLLLLRKKRVMTRSRKKEEVDSIEFEEEILVAGAQRRAWLKLRKRVHLWTAVQNKGIR